MCHFTIVHSNSRPSEGRSVNKSWNWMSVCHEKLWAICTRFNLFERTWDSFLPLIFSLCNWLSELFFLSHPHSVRIITIQIIKSIYHRFIFYTGIIYVLNWLWEFYVVVRVCVCWSEHILLSASLLPDHPSL